MVFLDPSSEQPLSQEHVSVETKEKDREAQVPPNKGEKTINEKIKAEQ